MNFEINDRFDLFQLCVHHHLKTIDYDQYDINKRNDHYWNSRINVNISQLNDNDRILKYLLNQARLYNVEEKDQEFYLVRFELMFLI